MRRVLAVAVAAALTWTMTTAAAEAATTQIGSVAEADANQAPNPATTNGDTYQQSTTAERSYVVPAGYGVITKLRHRTGTASGLLTFKVYRPTGIANTLVTVASEPRQVVAGASHAFDVRIPVQPGDVLGLSSSTGVQEAYAGTAGNTVGAFPTPDPAPGQTVVSGSASNSYYLDVAAVVETDADKDGYGDDTQDLCPTDPATYGKCLVTTIDKAPKGKVLTTANKAKVKLKFSSPDAAATFQCAVDGGTFAACSSPFKKKYKLGKHTVSVRSVNALGVADATPAVTTFKVKRKPRAS